MASLSDFTVGSVFIADDIMIIYKDPNEPGNLYVASGDILVFLGWRTANEDADFLWNGCSHYVMHVGNMKFRYLTLVSKL